MHSSYKEPVDLAASYWTNFLHITSFAFFAPFVRHRSVSCSLPCTLTSFVVLIMERVSLTVHVFVRSCIFCTTLAAFLALLWAIVCKIPIRGRLLQTLALLLKLLLDLVPATLGALNSSKSFQLDDSKPKACLTSGHTMTDGLTDRNHLVGRLYPALLLLYMYYKLRGKYSLNE